jgi:diguanylate cyclase (GGDEF)-like protein
MSADSLLIRGDFLKLGIKKYPIIKKTIQMASIALIAGLILYWAVTGILVNDLENSLIRFAEQGAATVREYVNGRMAETKSMAENSIIKNSRLPIEKRLEELRAQLKLDSYRRLSIADLDGNAITTDGVKLNVKDREYFQEAVNGKPSVSDPIKSRADGTMVIVFAVPIYDGDNVTGVLYVTYDADVLSIITDDIRLSDSGYTFIINENGDIIAHVNRQLVYDMVNDIRSSLEDPELSRLAELEKRMIAGERGTGEYNYQGEARYMGFCPIENTGWSIAVTAPKSAVFSKLNIVSIILFLLILAASFIIAIIMSRSKLLKIDLQRHQVNSHRIADFTSLIALTVKNDGTILTTNRYAEDLLLYFDKFGDEKVKNIFDLVSEKDRLSLQDTVGETLENDSSTSFELALSRGDSKVVHIYCNAVTDRDNADIIELFGIDITERVIQENILQDSFEELTVVYDELAAKEEKIRELAFRDQLTGLPNRTALYTEVDKVISQLRTEEKCALLYLDLDNFKYINDSFSHSIGDMLIVEIGRRIMAAFSDNELVARFEGDEFVVFIRRISSIDELNEKVSKAMSVFIEPFNVMRNHFHVSASCGICIYPDHANSIEEMMKSSDVAMYHAKKEGKNTHIMFRQDMNDEFARRIEMENGLRHAIDNNEFILYYQPQVDLTTGSIVSFEALLRWMHPMHGIIPPYKFINVAEETGLIVQIGKWVLKTACDFIGRLNNRSSGKYGISVNISVVQLMQADFVNMVEDIVTLSGIKPGLLELEITESKLVETVDINLRKIFELREFGVRFSIDDFGKGFSSLSYLKQLPVNTLKIDKCFVDDIPDNDNSMIESIIHIGHRRNLVVVAEGVEKKEQIEYLSQHKCDMIQGYYYSKPVPEEDIYKLL